MMKVSIAMLKSFGDLVESADRDIGLHDPGHLYLTSLPDAPDRMKARVGRQHGLGLTDAVEPLMPSELPRWFPYTSPEATPAASLAGEGWFSVHEATYRLAAGCAARFLIETKATKILVQGDRVTKVETKRGPIRCPAIDLAAGPSAKQIAAIVGINLPLTNFKEQKAVVHHHDAIPAEAPVTIDLDTSAFGCPEAGHGEMVSTGLADPMDAPLDPVPMDWTFPALAVEAASRLSPL